MFYVMYSCSNQGIIRVVRNGASRAWSGVELTRYIFTIPKRTSVDLRSSAWLYRNIITHRRISHTIVRLNRPQIDLRSREIPSRSILMKTLLFLRLQVAGAVFGRKINQSLASALDEFAFGLLLEGPSSSNSRLGSETLKVKEISFCNFSSPFDFPLTFRTVLTSLTFFHLLPTAVLHSPVVRKPTTASYRALRWVSAPVFMRREREKRGQRTLPCRILQRPTLGGTIPARITLHTLSGQRVPSLLRRLEVANDDWFSRTATVVRGGWVPKREASERGPQGRAYGCLYPFEVGDGWVLICSEMPHASRACTKSWLTRAEAARSGIDLSGNRPSANCQDSSAKTERKSKGKRQSGLPPPVFVSQSFPPPAFPVFIPIRLLLS